MAHWNFDGLQDGAETAADRSGRGAVCRLTHAKFTARANGLALQCGGDAVKTVGHATLATPGIPRDAVTLAAWVRLNEAQPYARGNRVPQLDAWGMTSRDGLYAAGDIAGIAGADAAILRGRIAALGLAQRLGKVPEPAVLGRAAPLRRALRRQLALRRFLDALYPPRPEHTALRDDTLVCRCEEVTAGEICSAAKEFPGGPDQVKAHTRAGMATCKRGGSGVFSLCDICGKWSFRACLVLFPCGELARCPLPCRRHSPIPARGGAA